MRFRNFAKLSVEELESRWTPAGNVTASLVGDTVYIDGDPFDNQIRVDAGPHHVAVFGESGTTINQQSLPATFGPFPTGSPPKIVMQTAQGDDFISLSSGGCGDVTLLTGVGNDEVLLLPNRGFADNVTIDTAQGNDSIRLLDFICLDNLYVDSGQGNDALDIEGLAVLGDVVMATGEGNDSVRMSGSSSLGDLLMDGALSLDGGLGHSDSLFLDFGLNAPPDEMVIEGFELP